MTQVKCPKSYKSYFTVIKKVKKAHEINDYGENQVTNLTSQNYPKKYTSTQLKMPKYKYMTILFLYESRIFETSDLIMFANCPVAKLY